MSYLWPSVIQPWFTIKKLISSWSVHVLRDKGFISCVVVKEKWFICCSPSDLVMLCSYELDHLDTASFTLPGGRHRVLQIKFYSATLFRIKTRILITFGYVQFQGSWHLASSQELHSKQSIALPAEMKEFLSLSLSFICILCIIHFRLPRDHGGHFNICSSRSDMCFAIFCFLSLADNCTEGYLMPCRLNKHWLRFNPLFEHLTHLGLQCTGPGHDGSCRWVLHMLLRDSVCKSILGFEIDGSIIVNCYTIVETVNIWL